MCVCRPVLLSLYSMLASLYWPVCTDQSVLTSLLTSLYWPVCTDQSVLTRLVCTGQRVPVSMYQSVCTGQFVVCTDRSVPVRLMVSFYRSSHIYSGQHMVSLCRVVGEVQRSHCALQAHDCSGQSVVGLWSVCGQSVVSLWSVCGRSVVSLWSVRVVLQEKSSGRTAHYKLTSTAMLWLQTNKEGSGTMNLGGSLTRQASALTTLHSLHWLTPSNGGIHLQRLPSLVFLYD